MDSSNKEETFHNPLLKPFNSSRFIVYRSARDNAHCAAIQQLSDFLRNSALSFTSSANYAEFVRDVLSSSVHEYTQEKERVKFFMNFLRQKGLKPPKAESECLNQLIDILMAEHRWILRCKLNSDETSRLKYCRFNPNRGFIAHNKKRQPETQHSRNEKVHSVAISNETVLIRSSEEKEAASMNIEALAVQNQDNQNHLSESESWIKEKGNVDFPLRTLNIRSVPSPEYFTTDQVQSVTSWSQPECSSTQAELSVTQKIHRTEQGRHKTCGVNKDCSLRLYSHKGSIGVATVGEQMLPNDLVPKCKLGKNAVEHLIKEDDAKTVERRNEIVSTDGTHLRSIINNYELNKDTFTSAHFDGGVVCHAKCSEEIVNKCTTRNEKINPTNKEASCYHGHCPQIKEDNQSICARNATIASRQIDDTSFPICCRSHDQSSSELFDFLDTNSQNTTSSPQSVRHDADTAHQITALSHNGSTTRCCRQCQFPCPRPTRSFCSEGCLYLYKLRSSSSHVRTSLLIRDKGICQLCSLDCENLRRAFNAELRQLRGSSYLKQQLASAIAQQLGPPCPQTLKVNRRGLLTRGHFFHADHILAVVEGGGNCGLENFRTLCVACHSKVTAELRKNRSGKQSKENIKFKHLQSEPKGNIEDERTEELLEAAAEASRGVKTNSDLYYRLKKRLENRRSPILDSSQVTTKMQVPPRAARAQIQNQAVHRSSLYPHTEPHDTESASHKEVGQCSPSKKRKVGRWYRKGLK